MLHDNYLYASSVTLLTSGRFGQSLHWNVLFGILLNNKNSHNKSQLYVKEAKRGKGGKKEAKRGKRRQKEAKRRQKEAKRRQKEAKRRQKFFSVMFIGYVT